MGKLTTYILVLSGIFILLHISGVIGIGEGSWILSVALNPNSITNTEIYLLVATGIGSVVAAAGFLALTGSRILQFDLIASAALCIFLLSFVQDIIILWIKIAAYSNSYLATLIISPFIIIFPLIIMSYWRGHDG